MSLVASSRSLLDRRLKERSFSKIYDQFRDFTMIAAKDYVDNLILAESVSHLEGCVIECGVWRGGMIAGMARVLGGHRHYYLFDSFEGLPPARDIDGAAALEWQRNTDSPNYHDNCSAGREFANTAMKRAGVSSFELVQGWFEQTLPAFSPTTPIALLRLDADWYDSTIVCLETLFDSVAPGGLIVLDDYYTWDGCSRALHDFLSRHSLAERIRNLGSTCYLRKL